ncbi:DegV family protein [Chloroflexota bacterium]
MTVKIVTDSVADLPHQVISELGITVVPLNVRFGTEVYRDGVDLTTEQFYSRLTHSKTLPVTSVPSPGTFAKTYDKLAEETDEILAIIVSARLSGTYEVALQSIELMKQKCRVEVIDSQFGAAAEGLVVIAAAKTAQVGAGIGEVIDVTRKAIPRVDMRAAFDTLEYLKRGGRIGRAQAFLGSVLNVNPIITLKGGVVEPVGRMRSRGKAMDYLYSFAMSFSHIDGIAIEDAACPKDAELLVERLSPKFPKGCFYRSRTTPVIGTHTGPGLLLVAILGDKE